MSARVVNDGRDLEDGPRALEGGPPDLEGAPVGTGAEDVPAGLTHQLRSDQFRHVATLSLAGAGGTLALLQGGLIGDDTQVGTTVAMFVIAAALALFGQDKLIVGLEDGRGRTRPARLFLGLAMAVLGAGVGSLLQLAL